MLSIINASRCEPPLSEKEVLSISKSCCNYTALSKKEIRSSDGSESNNCQAENPHRKMALEILEKGDSISFLRETYKKLHSGDIEVLEVIFLAAAAQSVIYVQGIQPSLSGPKGSGKTSSVKAALHLFPPEYVVNGSFSSKALFYQNLSPGTIIFSDDTELPDDINATIKRAMSNFQESTDHITIDKNRVPVRLKIPPRTVFLLTAVGDSGDDQLNDRQFKIGIEPSEAADKQFVEFVKQMSMLGKEDQPLTDDVLVSREIVREIKSHIFQVRIPFADRLEFHDISQRRDIRSFMDFIKAVTTIRFMQRYQSFAEGNNESNVTLTATEDDYREALRIFHCNGDIRKFKLTREERALWDFIAIAHGGEIIESTLIDELGKKKREWSRAKIRRLLYGRDEKGGLLSKIPGMHVIKELRETSSGKRYVNVIKCPTTPTVFDNNEFVTLHPLDETINSASDPDRHSPDPYDGSRSILGQSENGTPKSSNRAENNSPDPKSVFHVGPLQPKKGEEGDPSHMFFKMDQRDVNCDKKPTINEDYQHPTLNVPDPSGSTTTDQMDQGGRTRYNTMDAALKEKGINYMPDLTRYRRIQREKIGYCMVAGCTNKKVWEDESGLNFLCDQHFTWIKNLKDKCW